MAGDAREESAAAPAGSISVIIPALNEETHIGETLACLRGADIFEVIVADGGSSDGTAEIAEAMGAITLRAPRGRATQQNFGAERAMGELLLFLHADTVLPPDFASQIRSTLARPGTSAGAFRFRLDACGWRMTLVERMVALRCALLSLPYGDQAIFVTRKAFRRVGGFRNLAAMEDFDFIRRLQRIGRVRLARSAAITSARRWIDGGLLRTTLLHQACLVGYHLGVRPELLASLRDADRG